MSRIGKKPIPIPEGIQITINADAVTVKGKLGELRCPIDPEYKVLQKENEIRVERSGESKEQRAKHGLYRMLIANMVEGVSKGFGKTLEIHGVGYSAELKGKSLFLNLGFSHPILITPPEGIKFEIPKNMVVKISGADKHRVGQIAARIRSISPPEPYKGKGIRYVGEHVHRKAGKKVGVK